MYGLDHEVKSREAGEPRKKAEGGRKRRGGRKREEERAPEAASQVVQLAAGETLRSSPCGAATSLSSPYSPVMGELGRCCCVAGAKGARIFKKIVFFRGNMQKWEIVFAKVSPG